ncbi:dicarboxylate/amino acid:cation symporter [Corynebacterium striatum]|uniref:Dicarboxylate/amino acid:cation symporter n=1 Tax=Corynebacterium striatum TaxID=43770 RepID=A0ABX7DBI7_CORST|nr:dicarboxylate/amino acid:cation symporter [Corynebacterium striatum]MCG7250299.1 dicarboxylate/amino acid:cation symporter [Corynebacterium striatum]QQU75976.1 dicarboxylate/amino acid:cation symporter [Corynebacterium striatum]QQU78724.1 dicarboxylate/amino acid:cation symporter [Corynebacterium striatum]HAT1360947.1 dicarboxylate/amino acid:cation symporter [Corynebacterium striatum]HBC8575775.1 dicarboxylate/amino acid:cation symporter [Corynebacterium striatum]
MNLKSITNSLLFKIIVAIILGIIASSFFPEWAGRLFATFNGLFSNFLGFFIPVLIFALVAPAIAGLGRGAGKWLGITAGIAYGSTIISGLIAYGLSIALYPTLLAGQSINTNVSDIEEGALAPYFTVEMPAPFEVMSALLLSFCVGVAMTSVKSDNLYAITKEFENVVVKVIWGFVIPWLPIYIFGMFLSLGMNGNLGDVLVAFAKVLILAVVMTIVYLVFQYILAGIISGKNPFTALKNMAPAYFTALGTSSSAATIPVTLESSLKNGISKPVAGFVIPLCATIHLSGSMMKLTLYAFAIVTMTDMDVSFGKAMSFIFLLGIMMIAAPGVPGGAVMVAVGLLQANMGFDESLVALMIAAYIAIDSVGTAANVTGDGAIAMIVDRFAREKIDGLEAEADAEPARQELS